MQLKGDEDELRCSLGADVCDQVVMGKHKCCRGTEIGL